MRHALLLSLLAHALVLLVWRPQTSESPAPDQVGPLQIVLRRPPPAVDPGFPPKIGRPHPASLPPVAASPGPAAAAPLPVTTAAGHDAPDWLASSRAQIAAESRRRMVDPMFARPPPATFAVSPLARATRPARPGETLLREGLVRIVSANGSAYCLQRPPDIVAGDGQLGILAVPMNCP